MKKVYIYITMTIIAIIMLYPILWLIGASFKTNSEIFSSIWFFPKRFDFEPYINAWKTSSPYNIGHYFINTSKIIIPRIVFTLVSTTLTAYGFERFNFPFKKILFGCLMCMMFMPQIVTLMPMYNFWNFFGLLDTYIPLILPSLFATEGMFVFVLIQFFKGIPKEFDEAAKIDGCGTLKILWYIHIPCIKSILISITVFVFLWTMNEFMTPLLYISSVEKYPLSMALRMSVDSTGQGYEYSKIIAMSIIGLVPSIVIFAIAQKYFTNGIATGGIKG